MELDTRFQPKAGPRMTSAFASTLAWRYLRPARREKFVSAITAFSVIGIMLGVATLILVTSLMNGIRSEMTQLFIGIDGPISLHTAPMPIEDSKRLADTLATREGITYARPKLEGQLMATHNGRANGVQVLALYGDDFASKPILAEKLPPLSGDGLLIGKALARSLGAQPGDTIKLISPQGRHSFAGFVPRIKSFRVAGVFRLGMHLYDSTLIIMPFDDAALFFKPPQSDIEVTGQIELGVADIDMARRTAARLQAELGDQGRVLDWQQSNASLFRALDVQRNVMLVILALIILVAAFNIISSLIMLVQDKRGDIAILRTMGASRGQVIRAFCLSGTLIGTLGTLLGVALGLLAATYLEPIKAFIERLIGHEILVEEIYFLSSLPTRTDPAEVMAIALLAIALSFAATIYPARRAASVNPAEALRYG